MLSIGLCGSSAWHPGEDCVICEKVSKLILNSNPPAGTGLDRGLVLAIVRVEGREG